MEKVIGGKTYVQVPCKIDDSCDGCAAESDNDLCGKLHRDDAGNITPGICAAIKGIFKEQTMSEQKTALELVDELNRYLTRGPLGCHDPTATSLAKSIKAAIERERAKDTEEYSALMNVSADRAGIISDLTAQLKSAVTMRPIMDELVSNGGNITATLSNILCNWSAEKQHLLARALIGDSMIEMRPISELPDKVPDGCCLCLVGPHYFHGGFVTGLPKAAVSELATHFYILPMPKAERKLHPCYMPGCGGQASIFVSIDGDGYFVHCDKCGATGPVRADEDAAEQAWGHAE